MKKPAWIRVFGWLFIFSCGLFVTGMVMVKPGIYQPEVGVLTVAAWLIGGPSLFMWVIASLVFRFSVAHANNQAQAMATVLQKLQQPRMACAYPGPDGMRCDLPAGHQGPHRGVKPGPRAVQTSPLGLTGTDKQ